MTEYLEKIRSHLRDMINDLKKSGEWKIHLTMKSKFMSLTDSDEKRTMYSKNDNSAIMIGNNADEIIQNFFDQLAHKYHIGLEQSMQGSKFVLDYVSGMLYLCNNISINHGGQYINSSKWIKSKKAIINLNNNNDGKCFQYAVTDVLIHEQIKTNL